MASNLQRFMSKVQVQENGCWLWTGNVNPNGYGYFWWNGKKDAAHRFSYETFKGSIPRGLEHDHLCRHRNCVNPAHLELVTRSVNTKRGLKGMRWVHCKHGHSLDEKNTIVDKRGRRQCRICSNARSNEFVKNHKEYYNRKSKEYYYAHLEQKRAEAREYQRKRRENGTNI